MLRVGSALRHLECVAWKPGELWETPWLRGHISGTLLNSSSNACNKGREGGRAVPQHQDQHCQGMALLYWVLLRQNETNLTLTNGKSTRNTWAHKEDNVGTLVQSTRQKSHLYRHLTACSCFPSHENTEISRGKRDSILKLKCV